MRSLLRVRVTAVSVPPVCLCSVLMAGLLRFLTLNSLPTGIQVSLLSAEKFLLIRIAVKLLLTLRHPAKALTVVRVLVRRPVRRLLMATMPSL